jgi:hypothetical protein
VPFQARPGVSRGPSHRRRACLGDGGLPADTGRGAGRLLRRLADELTQHREFDRAISETQQHFSRSAEAPASSVTADHHAAHGYEATREAAMSAFAKS